MKKKKKPLTRAQRLWSHWYLRWSVYILAPLFLLTLTAPWWNPVVFPPVKNPIIGVSFSEKRAREMGVNWQSNYLALLDDMGLRSFRLMSYWDIHEPSPGQLDFTTLDWQINEATKRGATVSLAIGLRQPRWPECHEPAWANTLGSTEKQQALNTYITAVVQRYENNPTVISWQLENEGMNNWFGKCATPDRQRLIEEFALVKSLTHKPVWASLSDQHGLPLGKPGADKFGYSVYRTVWSDKTWPYIGYITYPTPIWYHRLRAVIIKLTTGKDIFIHELQLEPWGQRDTTQLSVAEQDKSMDRGQIANSLLFAREIGAPDIYTWGGEWWYWRMVNGDPSIWNTVKDEFRKAEED